MGRWPLPGESQGFPRNHCRLTCRPSCPVNAAARGNPPTQSGQWSVTVGTGRHGLAQHFRLKRHCEWRQCELRSISLASSTHSIYVQEHSLSKAVLTALHHSSTSRATGLVPGEVQKCSATPPFSCRTYCYRTTTIDRLRMVRMYITLNTK